jgi:UDP-glucose 4-epimerase
MRLLVTGGAGYIGSQTVRLLRRAGHDVVVLDNLEQGHPAAIDDARLVVGSIADRGVVRPLLADGGFEAVVHFAGLKAAGESVEDPARYLDVNVGGTLALLAELDRAGIGAFVFSSSCAVYGEPDHVPVDETAPSRPTTPYGESKLLVERALPWYEGRGLRSVALRYFNAAGAELDGSHGEDSPEPTNLFPVVVRAALGRGPAVEVFGTDYPTADGTAIRDYVHVVDLAEAHVAALAYLADGGAATALNLGTGRGSSVRDVIGAVESASRRLVPTVMSGRRAGDVAAIWADPSRAAATLGWRATRPLQAIAESAVRWAELHPDGYEDRAGVPPRASLAGADRG